MLLSTSAVAADDVWAVGKRYVDYAPVAEVQHWDGAQWQEQAIGAPGTNQELYAVDAAASNDVWAVGGYTTDGFETFAPLAEHWDGSTWTSTPAPNPAGAMAVFYAISRRSASDVWAVGTQYTSGQQFGLVEHWNGSAWSVVPSPPDAGALNGVSAVSANDAWAVGNYALEHWDGSSWQKISTYPAVISNVTALHANDVWVVGWKGHHAYTTHWNGTSWTEVPAASLPGRTQFYAVSGTSATDVWAVGARRHNGVFRTLTEHWDGSAWTVVHAPAGKAVSELRDVSALSTGDAWAVGHTGNAGLTAHWDGTVWTRVPIS